MKKVTLEAKTDAAVTTTKEALQLLWDNINKGQKKQLYKIESIKNMLDFYGVDVGI